MNIKRFTRIRLIVSSTILIIMIIVSNYLNLKVSKNVSSIIEYKNKVSDNGITFEELNKVKEKCKDLKLTGYKEVHVNTANIYGILPGRKIKTKLVLTDENYFSLYPSKIIRGGKIDYLSARNGDKIAVISDGLAVSLFKNIDVIGNTLIINNEKYKIIGVYKENKSLMYNASDDGYKRIYVPYASYKNTSEKGGNFLDIISTKETSDNGEKIIYDKLTKVLGNKLSTYNVYNYTISKKIIYEQIHILYFIMGTFTIIFLLKIMIKHIKGAVIFLKVNIKDRYLREIIKENTRVIKIVSRKILFYLIGIIVIFSIIKFNIIVVDKYLPTENVFDINFYKGTIIRDIQLINANENGVNNIYNRYLSNAIRIQHILLFMGTVTFIVVLVDIKAEKIVRHFEK
ncbi:ABC transporter permease [Clostridium sp. P21]|uniref:ABC transporter permease n=1 Tax=Clostridium muellerianum TaxID=2716538 RepID=A0A7Y0EHC3_9CLOT|nr:ABC transporter permease [Clostridium muellerianum]